ncbi:MAG TPA: hypothetical protein VFK90_02635, partial [Anaeromyxobacter sp.]|nr:hypothetical protein [Anaeromyxobacter sp.]
MSAAALAAGMAVLGRALRAHGIGVGLGDEVDAARALWALREPDREDTRRALRIALKLRRGEWGRLDAVLDEAWPAAAPASANPAARAPTASIDGKRPGRAPAEARRSAAPGGAAEAPPAAEPVE